MNEELELGQASLVIKSIKEPNKTAESIVLEVNEFILKYTKDKNISYIITNEDSKTQYHISVLIDPTFGQISALTTEEKIENLLQNPSFSDKVQICSVPMSSKQGQDFLNIIANINYIELLSFFTLYQIYINNKISSRNKKKNQNLENYS